MPRVHHVKRAAKDNAAVKKGQPYYWWKFRYGGKRVSATPPRPSQLTMSKMSSVLSAQEALEDLRAGSPSYREAAEALESAHDSVEEVAGEYEEAAEAMGGAGEENQERADALSDLQYALEEIRYRAEAAADADENDDPAKDEELEVDEASPDSLLEEALDLDWQPF
jgi:hypothetical protein